MKNLFILTLLLILSSLGYTQTKSFSLSELKNSGYCRSALDLVRIDLDQMTANEMVNLAELYYELRDYKRSLEIFDEIDSNFSYSQEQKKVFFDILRISGQYDKALYHVPTTYMLDSNWQEHFVQFPKISSDTNEFVKLEKWNLKFGTLFMGLAKLDKKVLITKETSEFTQSSDLYFHNFASNDTLTKGRKIKTQNKKNSFIYRANPTFVNDVHCIYTKSVVGYTSYNEKKSSKSVSNNVLKLFMYDSESEIEQELSILNLDNNNCVTPYYWKEKDVLIYSSSNSNTDNYDLFYSSFINGLWSKPIKLGFVNSPFSEIYPFIQNGILYFSSRGHNSFGGLDMFSVPIFYSDGVLSIKSEPTNLGKPLNSSFDDFSLVYFTDSSGFFASNRDGVNGADELFKFSKEEEHIETFQILDKNGLTISDANVELYQLGPNESRMLVGSYVSNDKGEIELELKSTEDYELQITKDNFEPKTVLLDSPAVDKEILLPDVFIYGSVSSTFSSKTIGRIPLLIYELKQGEYQLIDSVELDANGQWRYPFDRNKDYKVELDHKNYEIMSFFIPSLKNNKRNQFIDNLSSMSLVPVLKSNDVVELENVTFDLNSSILNSESYPVLDSVISFLKKNPTIKVELSAHTDCEGDDKYNLWLSLRRAKSCVNYITNKGISPKRLIPEGYGERYILNGCLQPGQCSKEKNRENRRVEIKIK